MRSFCVLSLALMSWTILGNLDAAHSAEPSRSQVTLDSKKEVLETPLGGDLNTFNDILKKSSLPPIQQKKE